MSDPGKSCLFCRSQAGEFVKVGELGESCHRCARRLGNFIQEGGMEPLHIFPVLGEEDEEGPEPMVRLSDGRRVELRAHTEELKKDLTVDQRAELTDTYVKIGLLKEAIVEAGIVLVSGALGPSERVLGLLFKSPLSAPDAVERVRPFLLPV